MSNKQIPCIDCICFVICKECIRQHCETPLFDLCRKCSILNTYMKADDDLFIFGKRKVDVLYDLYDVFNIRMKKYSKVSPYTRKRK